MGARCAQATIFTAHQVGWSPAWLPPRRAYTASWFGGFGARARVELSGCPSRTRVVVSRTNVSACGQSRASRFPRVPQPGGMRAGSWRAIHANGPGAHFAPKVGTRKRRTRTAKRATRMLSDIYVQAHRVTVRGPHHGFGHRHATVPPRSGAPSSPPASGRVARSPCLSRPCRREH